ncbi:hypothetical protein GCM10009676_08280 [Prauserella halophila]|uniref:Uncharacterized protein n=1 Tax=Prauserella halophila TaxID=185641 RepID=A0ABN1W2H7_9PSEU|nr:hypothetical protein [Prauserella halophila]MCP2235193.1 hypothetical protein [Prauserella halophila]
MDELGAGMIRRDRELLVHLSAVNTRLGEAVVELCTHQDGGQLPADGLRALGEHLQHVATRLLTRASELESAAPATALDQEP